MKFLSRLPKPKIIVSISSIIILFIAVFLTIQTHVLSFSSPAAEHLADGVDTPSIENQPTVYADTENTIPTLTPSPTIRKITQPTTHTPTSVATLAPTSTQSNPAPASTSQPSTPTSSSTPTPTTSPATTPTSAPTSNNNTITSFITYYGWADNSPPGTDIAFPGFPNTVHTAAGGAGTYSDPITMATAQNTWPVGTRMYVPYLQKYVILEDICGGCDNDVSAGKYHIDIWMNSDSTHSDQLLSCENAYTKAAEQVEINPPADRPVNATPLFDPTSGTCLSQ